MNKKIILSGAAAALTSVALPLVVVSCGSPKNTNPWANSKTIVVAVDGAQQKMWDTAIAEFNKSDYHNKKGFNIKTIKKDVFGAIDIITTVGYTDENAPDLLYMPQDKMTSMLQQKALMPMDETTVNNFLTEIGASDTEKTAAKEFGEAEIMGQERVFSVPHNKEGIAIATTKEANSATRTELNTGVVDLQNAAKGLFRIQDLWYGSALFSKPVTVDGKNKTAADYILYGDKSNWDSGFAKIADENAKDPITTAFREISDTMSDMWYEPLMKAYNSGATPELIGDAWAQNTIKSDSLKNFFQNDLNAVNNSILDWVAQGKIDYMYAGTWDSNVLAKKKINTFLNPAHNLTKNGPKTDFIQASGTWSFGVNSRNNGASQDRINAIFELLKNVYDGSTFKEYYKSDSKIPYFKSIQDEIKTGMVDENKEITDKSIVLYKDASFQTNVVTKSGISMDTTLTDGSKIISEMSKWLSKYAKKTNDLKEYVVSSEWSGAHGAYTNPTFPSTMDASLNPYADQAYLGVIGLLDLLKTTLGITNEIGWKVPLANLKDGIKDAANFKSLKADDTSLHARKMQKALLGFNGDNAEEKTAFTNKFKINLKGIKNIPDFKKKVTSAKAEFDGVVTNMQNAVKSFQEKFMKAGTTVADDDAKTAVSNYLNNLWNVNLRDAQYNFINTNVISKLEFNLSGNKKISYSDMVKQITDASKTLTLNKVFNVITSITPESPLGEYASQTGRFDRINPQFGTVWTMWNDNTFGSKTFLKDSIESIYNNSALTTHDNAELAFKKSVRSHLQKLFKDKLAQLIAAKATGKVDMS